MPRALDARTPRTEGRREKVAQKVVLVHGPVWVNDGGEGGVAWALAIRCQQTKALSGPPGSLVQRYLVS